MADNNLPDSFNRLHVIRSSELGTHVFAARWNVDSSTILNISRSVLFGKDKSAIKGKRLFGS